MGRPKKPLEKHKLEGTYQSCRHAGPRPELAEPGEPEGLTGDALKMWRKYSPIISEMGIYTDADELAFRMLCESYALYVAACKDIEKNGQYETQLNRMGNVYYTENPSVKQRAKHWREVIDICRQFGLTPSSRTGLHVGKKEENEISELAKILKGSRN